VLKLDLDGRYVWAKVFGNAGFHLWEGASSVAVNTAGDVYVTGTFGYTVDFDPSPSGQTKLTANKGQDAFVLKLTSEGEFAWVGQIGGTGYDVGTSITLDRNGQIYVAGHSQGNDVDLDPGLTTKYVVEKVGDPRDLDVFVVKLDTSNAFVWGRKARGSGQDEGFQVSVDSAGSVYVGGRFSSKTVDFGDGPRTAGGGYDGFLWKLDSGGQLAGVRQIGSRGDDCVDGLALTAAGTPVVSGTFSQTVDFAAGSRVVRLQAAALPEADHRCHRSATLQAAIPSRGPLAPARLRRPGRTPQSSGGTGRQTGPCTCPSPPDRVGTTEHLRSVDALRA
jgi:hypothetical protein